MLNFSAAATSSAIHHNYMQSESIQLVMLFCLYMQPQDTKDISHTFGSVHEPETVCVRAPYAVLQAAFRLPANPANYCTVGQVLHILPAAAT